MLQFDWSIREISLNSLHNELKPGLFAFHAAILAASPRSPRMNTTLNWLDKLLFCCFVSCLMF
jgi:hypothetical protein